MNKLEIKRVLLDDINARITYDFINGDIILLSSEGSEVNVFEVIDCFDALTYAKKHNYWTLFMQKCGKNIKVPIKSYEEEKEMAFLMFEKFIHEGRE
ncbi:hypothetical protein [Bacillus sp. AFS019443]|uniref:hypothetical protein n=1 Tax=Bacillus sp. AFS019443 TaxID=2034279 RepID=UPI000BFA84AE|nr:hypothetical protein [Bacillus sp. AFS019443]PEU16786.1 hypothetical protein CN524_03400 [Bacillus sp. AFS019443]